MVKEFRVMPIVSIIIPVYNREDYISDCINSVVNQTMTDFEIVVVDDGSTDSTPEILQKFSNRDKRIVIIRQDNSGKPSVARNSGIKHATGQYITFLDSDDYYEPNKLERECSLLEINEDINLVFSDMYTATVDGVKDQKTYLQQANFNDKVEHLLKNVGNNNYLCPAKFYNFMSTEITSVTTPTAMIRRSRLLQEREWFPESMVIGEDIDLWFRLAKNAEILFIDEPLACNRQHGNSITKNVEKYINGAINAHFINYERSLDVLTPPEKRTLEVRISSYYFDLAYHLKQHGRYHEANTAYTESLKWCFSVKTVFAIIKSSLSALINVRSKVKLVSF
jgi:glycosyltransferase involved in cell wall biosynthesis